VTSTAGAVTILDRSVHVPPAVLPIAITASPPTRRPSAPGGLTDRVDRTTRYPSRADAAAWLPGDGSAEISAAVSGNTALPATWSAAPLARSPPARTSVASTCR